MSHGGDLFASREQDEMKRIWEWSHKTRDGTLSDLDPAPDPAVWQQVCSEPHICTPRTCGMGTECFYQRARKEADVAKVLVLNHSLFFSGARRRSRRRYLQRQGVTVPGPRWCR